MSLTMLRTATCIINPVLILVSLVVDSVIDLILMMKKWSLERLGRDPCFTCHSVTQSIELLMCHYVVALMPFWWVMLWVQLPSLVLHIYFSGLLKI